MKNNDKLIDKRYKSSIGVIFYDKDGKLIKVNPSALKLLRIRSSDLSNGFNLFDNPNIKKRKEKLLNEGIIRFQAPLNFDNPEQSGMMYIDWTVSIVNSGFLVQIQDITKNRSTDEDLRRLATIVNDSNDAITLFDLNGNIKAWNVGAEQMYGYTAEEMLETNILDIVPENQRKKDCILMNRLREGELVNSFETQRKAENGQILDVWLTVTTLKDTQGKPYAVATTERDITKRKGSEEHTQELFEEMKQLNEKLNVSNEELNDTTKRLKVSNEELQETTKELKVTNNDLMQQRDGLKQERDDLEKTVEERTAEIKEAYDTLKERESRLKDTVTELKSSNEELESFAYITSHDLQEPLRTVASYAQLLERRYKGKIDKDADDFLEFMVSGAKRMKKQIQGILDYSRIGTHGEKFREFNAEEALNIALSNLQASIKECNAEITHDPLPIICADESQIMRVFQNLIGNALRFRKEGVKPKVHISAKKTDNEYVFSINDNGIGMEMQYTDKIFEVFKRIHAIGEYSGAGIGLAIVKRIIDRHGGRLWVESKLGKGSTFYFTISLK